MRFFVFCVLLAVLFVACVATKSNAASTAKTKYTTLLLTSDSDADNNSDETTEDMEACGFFKRVARPFKNCRPFRNIRPFRGRCSSCS